MSQKLKIGVIGVGHMGRNHARVLSQETMYFDFVGIYDNSESKASEVANQYGIKAYRDGNTLLNDVDAVVLAVPSSLHKEMSLMAASKGVHALVEKPLAPTVLEAEEIVEAFENEHLKLQVERFNPAYVELKKIVNCNDVFFIEAHRYSPFNGSGRITDVGVVEDLMIHDIDLVAGLMSPYDVKTIKASGESVISNQVDFSTALINFKTNAHAVINASRVSQNKERMINVHMMDSTVNADLLTRTILIRKNTDIDIDVHNGNLIKQNGVIQEVFVPSTEPLREELVSFYKSCVCDWPILCDGKSGLDAVRISDIVTANIVGRYEGMGECRYECSV